MKGNKIIAVEGKRLWDSLMEIAENGATGIGGK